MVINLQRHRRDRADVYGHRWPVGMLNRDRKAMGRYRVFLNGRDVTDRTFFVDSRRGVVRMFLHRDGMPYVTDKQERATEERRGHVRLRRATEPCSR